MRIAIALLLACGLAGSAGAALAAGRAAETPLAGRPPERVYAVTCGYCHGHNVGPIILGRRIPAATVQAMVRGGRGAMPAFRPTEITNAELAALSRWIEKSKANPKEHGK